MLRYYDEQHQMHGVDHDTNMHNTPGNTTIDLSEKIGETVIAGVIGTEGRTVYDGDYSIKFIFYDDAE